MPFTSFVQLLERCKKFIAAKIDYFEGKYNSFKYVIYCIY